MGNKTDLLTELADAAYDGLTPAQKANKLVTDTVTRNRDSMTGSEVWENTDATQFGVLTDSQKSQWLAMCGIETLDPFGPAVSIAIDIFGGGTATITNLQAARVETVSKAASIGFGNLTEAELEEYIVAIGG